MAGIIGGGSNVDSDDFAPNPHDNNEHSVTFAQDGDSQPAQTHGNGRHSSNYVTSSNTPTQVASGSINNFQSDVKAVWGEYGDVGLCDIDGNSPDYVYSNQGGTPVVISIMGDGGDSFNYEVYEL